ncbi:MAG: DUF6399 domain-containing protein [Gammaproteobacteria bacterium]
MAGSGEWRTGSIRVFMPMCGEASTQRTGPANRRRSSLAAKALTVVHNDFTKRPDGHTPAQHFFGVQHEDLFAWLLDRLSPLARPARKRPKPLSQPVLAVA